MIFTIVLNLFKFVSVLFPNTPNLYNSIFKMLIFLVTAFVQPYVILMNKQILLPA